MLSLSLERRGSEQRLNVVEITRNHELVGPTARQTRHECNLTPRVYRVRYTQVRYLLSPYTRKYSLSQFARGIAWAPGRIEHVHKPAVYYLR